MLHFDRIRRVNVKGVDDLIQACVRCDVKRLVYTSTYNVVFAGQDIVAGDEGLDYPPDAEHPDLYGPSKAQAERTLLDFDGAGGGGGLSSHSSPHSMRYFQKAPSFGRFISLAVTV